MTTWKRIIFLGIPVIVIGVMLVLTILYMTRDYEDKPLDAFARKQLGGDYIQLSEGVVHYELTGPTDGPVVVLVHGFSIPSLLWEPIYHHLVEKGYRVLRFDLYGRGFSDRPDVAYDMQTYVNQLHELLDTLLPGQSVNLIGLSMGGAVVTHFTNRFPQKVLRVGLMAPLVKTPNNPILVPLLAPVIGDFLADIAIVPVVRNGVGKAVYYPESFPDWRKQVSRQASYTGFTQALLKTIRYLHGRSFISEYEKLGGLNKPVILIWGKNDKTLPFQDNQLLREVIPALDFYPLDESGHLPQYDQTQKVQVILDAFLRK